MKRLIFAVTNDLSFDQRMDRICSTLANEGYQVELVGRKRPASVVLKHRNYRQTRLNCFFEYGKIFYLEYNLRLFFYLLFKRFDVICAIDLDTIVPCYMASALRFKKVVYDSHEYFTEVIEVVNRPRIKKMWESIEAFFVPRCNQMYTVSESIQTIFNKKYGTNFQLIRNVARLENYQPEPKKEKYMIYIGAVNAGRGLKELVEAMQHIDCQLYICGDGDILDELIQFSNQLGLQDKVVFFGYVQPDKLKILTRNAYLGYLLLDNSSQSYYYSLANKFFDYMHAGIPQITVDFPEYRLINQHYKVAELISLNEEEIVASTNKLLQDKQYYDELVKNALIAREVYNWEKESETLLEIYKAI